MALSPDSVSYVSTAESFAAGRGLVAFDGRPLTLFPPGLSLAIGIFGSLGFSISAVAVTVNIVSLIVIVISTYLLALVISASWRCALAAAGIVSLSAPFTGVFVWVWTEPVFTAVTMVLLTLLAWAVREVRSSWWIVLVAGGLTSTAFGLRYVGLTLLPVLALGMWWAARNTPVRSRAIRVATAIAVGILLPVLLVARNLLSGAGPLGERVGGVRTIQDSFIQMIQVLGEFVLPPESGSLGILLGVGILILVFISLWVAVMNRDRPVMMLGFFLLVYWLSMIFSQASTRLDSPSARLLAPALPVLMLLGVMGARLVLRRVSQDLRKWSRTSPLPILKMSEGRGIIAVMWLAVTLVAVVAVIVAIRADLRLIRSGQAEEMGLQARVSSSQVLKRADLLPDARGFASDDPWLTYLGIGRTPVIQLPPDPAEWPESRVNRDREFLDEAVQAGSVTHAVLFDIGAESEMLAELDRIGITGVLVDETSDGSIYFLRPTPR